MGDDAAEYAALAADLRAAVDGPVRFDEYARVLYATDGSIYRARPAGAVEPRDVADVQSAVRIAGEHDVPIIARGAGSSLGGQAVGPGCVVLDLSTHMDRVVEIRPEDRRAVVQPGVVQDDLDARLAPHGLKFAPDPASSNRATVGGGIGNNSTGAHSVRYGITDEYTERLEVVLADGSRLETREVVLDSPEWDRIVEGDSREAKLYRTVRRLVEDNDEEIETRYPELKRNVSGYNLQKVVYRNENGERAINLSKLFVGAESTLGIVVEAELSLVTNPAETALALYCFEDLIAALEAVPAALEYDVSAVELMDDEVFRLARESEQYAAYEEPIPGGTAAALMVEFDSELVADFEAAIGRTNERFLESGAAFDAIEAYTDDAQADLWKLRKAAIPLLMSLEGDPKPYPFIEDATVPPEELADYTRKFEEILAAHDTSAAYFAHAGSGTLHIRPILSLKEGEGIEKMRSIADDVTDLVVEHHGAFSGEHGDGLARTEFNPKMYGETLWEAFRELKTAFDPEWRMNPGKVVYRDAEPTDMRDHLRYGEGYSSLGSQTELDFSDEGGFSHLVELCNGCGTCRQTETDVMCPTYRATGDEMATTRGRANMLRAAISGDLPEDELYTEEFQTEVLDLCVGCKGCKSDCPTGVDMAKLKTEVKHQYHEREGSSLRPKLFGHIDRLSRLGSLMAPLSNRATAIPGSRRVLESVFGIAADRSLPQFADESLREWADRRQPTISAEEADRKVLLFPDTYTNYNYPEAGKAAIRVLEAAGVHVRVPSKVVASGRAAYSVGLLGTAKERAHANVAVFSEYIDEGWEIVSVEPSDAVAFQDEYTDLVDDSAVDPVADHSYGVCEYLDVNRLVGDLETDETTAGTTPLTYHGHCHQHAAGKDHHAVGVLRRAGYAVDALDSGCCGMAGSFGYEAEHYDLSKAIGELLFEKIRASDGEQVVAPGGSCRSQIGDGDRTEGIPPHPIEMLDRAVVR